MTRETKLLLSLLVGGLLGVSQIGCGPKPTPVATNAPTPTPPLVPGPPPQVPGPPAAIPGPHAVVPGPPAVAPNVASTTDAPPANPTLPPAVTEEPAAALLATPPEPPATPTETVKAEKGVGIKGRSLDQHEGFVVTPVKTLFTVCEKAVFEIQLPKALQLYKANNDGKAPKTQEEFMQFVKENLIKLPMLPTGHTYEWDAENEELMVRRPKK